MRRLPWQISNEFRLDWLHDICAPGVGAFKATAQKSAHRCCLSWFTGGDSKPSLSVVNLPPPVNGLGGRELVGDLDRVRASPIDVGASERRKLPLTVGPKKAIYVPGTVKTKSALYRNPLPVGDCRKVARGACASQSGRL